MKKFSVKFFFKLKYSESSLNQINQKPFCSDKTDIWFTQVEISKNVNYTHKQCMHLV